MKYSAEGTAAAEAWAKGVKANLARKPQGKVAWVGSDILPMKYGDQMRALLGVELSQIQTRADELTTLVGLYQAVGGAPE